MRIKIPLTDTAELNINMRVDELIEGREQDMLDWQASRSLCKSSKPDSALGASALASCKSQGYRRREGNKSHKVGKNKRVKVGGKKIKGAAYGGPLPDWSDIQYNDPAIKG